MEKAVSVLEGYTWKNKQIKVKVRFNEVPNSHCVWIVFVWFTTLFQLVIVHSMTSGGHLSSIV